MASKDPIIGAAEKYLVQFSTAAIAAGGKPNFSVPFSLGAGGYVPLTDELLAAQSNLVALLAKTLGSKHAHEPTIRAEITNFAHTLLAHGKCNASEAKGLIAYVKAAGIDDYTFVHSNQLWRMINGGPVIQVGPVRIARTSELTGIVASLATPTAIKVGGPPKYDVLMVGAGIAVQLDELGPVCWVVDATCAKENLAEEARWLIDISTSLVRLMAWKELGISQNSGEIELRPFDAMRNMRTGVVCQGSKIGAGGAEFPETLAQTSELASLLASEDFKDLSQKILLAQGKGVPARLGQALGWLTRARQASDRSERLLGFFTALEALLSNKDPGSPVVDTIARRAGVIWSDDAESRFQIAGLLRRLYASRSSTVHTGARNVLLSEAATIQTIAEGVCFSVLRCQHVFATEDDFVAELQRATFGGAWAARSDGAPKES